MDMTKIARLIVKGFIQGIGYRAYIKENAVKLKVKGIVKNLQNNSVEIYCNTINDETYEKFKEMLISEDSEGTIEEIEEYFEDTEGYGKGPAQWIGFNIVRDEFSSIDESLEFMVRSGRQLMKKQDHLLDKQDQTLKTQNKMLEKQDQTPHAIKDLNKDLKGMDQHMNKNFNQLDSKYDKFSDSMARLEVDIKEMKVAFTKLVDHFVKDD